MYHKPVLLKECIDALAINPNGIYVDVTFGGGGHSIEILNKLDQGKLFAFDQDEDAKKNALDDERFMLIQANFRYLKNFLQLFQALPVDGILADLGISSHQIDAPERGFSTRFDGDLDLRMDQKNPVSARNVVNEYNEDLLIRIFKLYGELKNARHIASQILKYRSQAEIITSSQLKAALKPCMPRNKENKFLAQVYQALRIEVNEELEALKDLLNQSVQVLKPGGRLVVMSYHSLEDRLVKNMIRSGNIEGNIEKDFYGNIYREFNAITRKPIIPSEDEINENSRARSAKLRIAEKIV